MVSAFDRVAWVYRRRYWDIIFRLLEKPVDTVVDLGCGPGQNLFALIQRDLARRGIALDISYQMILRAYGTAGKLGIKHKILFIQADMVYCPIKSSSIDAAIAIASLHNILGKRLRKRALQEMNRILAPGGKLLITVWARYQLAFIPKLIKSLLNRLIGRVKEFGDTYIPWRHRGTILHRFYHLYSLGELSQEVEIAGLRIIDKGIYRPVKKPLRPTKNYYIIAVKRGRSCGDSNVGESFCSKREA